MHVFAADKIVVSGLFKDKAIVTINGKHTVLTVGKPTPEGIELISANANEAIIEANQQRKKYSLDRSISSNFVGYQGGETISIAPDRAGMYRVNGSINGFQVTFLVDTGATLISMNEEHAKRFGLDYKSKGKQGVSETASGLSPIYIVNLDTVMVGGIKLNDVRAAVHEGSFPKIILLGNTFLGRLRMNREGQILTLEEKPY